MTENKTKIVLDSDITLIYAKKMTKKECDDFIQKVLSKGSKLPLVDISTYSCSVAI